MKKGHERAFVLGFIGLICLVTLGSGGVAWGDDYEEWLVESRVDRYYDLPQTAREVGMAGAVGVTAADISSVYNNPAGLGFVKGPEVGLNYSHDELSGEDVDFIDLPGPNTFPEKAIGGPFRRKVNGRKDQGGLQLVLPCYSKGVFGFGGWYDDTDIGNNRDGEAERWRVNGGYGYAINDCMSIGYSLTYFNDEVDDDFSDYELDNGFRHTFGLQMRPCASPACVFGLSGYFAHGKPEVDTATIGSEEGDLDSWGLELGYSWQVLERTLLAASVDYNNHTFDGPTYDPIQDEFFNNNEDIDGWGFRVGVEQNYFNCLLARLGYRYQTWDYENRIRGTFFRNDQDFDTEYHAISTGIGWVYNPNLTLDYGLEYRFIGDGDLTNTVSARFHF